MPKKQVVALEGHATGKGTGEGRLTVRRSFSGTAKGEGSGRGALDIWRLVWQKVKDAAATITGRRTRPIPYQNMRDRELSLADDGRESVLQFSDEGELLVVHSWMRSDIYPAVVWCLMDAHANQDGAVPTRVLLKNAGYNEEDPESPDSAFRTVKNAVYKLQGKLRKVLRIDSRVKLWNLEIKGSLTWTYQGRKLIQHVLPVAKPL
jgi:hypothetical protein